MGFDTSTTAFRHAPRQLRGQRKVEHILRSAEGLFAEVGFDQATTNAIAVRAGVPIGSLYQFFASKEAILAAMADRYLQQTRSAMVRALESADQKSLSELFRFLLESLVKVQEQRPYFLQCLFRSRPSPVLNEPVADLSDALTNQMIWLLERTTTEPESKLVKLRARICVEIIGTLLGQVLEARGRDRTLVIDEIVAVLTRYLEPSLNRRGNT